MIRAAERDLDLDIARSVVVGDRWRDIELGRTIGAPAIMVRTGFASLEEPGAPVDVKPDAVVDNLAAAVAWILGRR